MPPRGGRNTWQQRPYPKERIDACIKRGRPVCFRSRSDMLKALQGENVDVLEAIDPRDKSGDTFDPVNVRLGLEGRRKARTIYQAMWAATAKGGRCLTDVDIKLLNEIEPIRRAGGLRLPGQVIENTADEAQAEYYLQRMPDADPDEDPPF